MSVQPGIWEHITSSIDIVESQLLRLDQTAFDNLLLDRTTRKNIIWATDDYSDRGLGFQADESITVDLVTQEDDRLIQPRVTKSVQAQENRTRNKAEVFTPSWVCNKQNNLLDEQWFGRKDVFNTETEQGWEATVSPVCFDGTKGWQKYVDEKRMEITCGEAPYLVSRYDTVTGVMIPIPQRIGLLDRKLRIVSENTDTEDDWWKWALRAFQSVYGFEYQGDNLLLARENLLATFVDYHMDRFGTAPSLNQLRRIATVISWNLWQMDGLKYVVPGTCHEEALKYQQSSFLDDAIKYVPCRGCQTGNPHEHNGTYCRIYDWRKKDSLAYISMMREAK